MDGGFHDVLVTLAAAVGLGLVVLLAIWIWAKVQPLPSSSPPLPPRREKAQEEALLTVPTWRKRAGGTGGGVAYERPLDIAGAAPALPDDAVLQPPREVAGHNGEA